MGVKITRSLICLPLDVVNLVINDDLVAAQVSSVIRAPVLNGISQYELNRVSVRMLRYYDAIGLLRPACATRRLTVLEPRQVRSALSNCELSRPGGAKSGPNSSRGRPVWRCRDVCLGVRGLLLV